MLLFNGEQRIRPDELKAVLPRSVYKASDKLHEQERDVVKCWKEEGMYLALLGIENQSDVMEEMPVRVIGYDGASYRSMLNKRHEEERYGRPKPPIYPVVTIVLYFGDRRWNKPKNLKGILDITKELEPYVNDYHVKIVEVQYLDDETVGKFRSDFRYVAELFTQKRKLREKQIEKIKLSKLSIAHAEETLELLAAVTGDRRFEEAFIAERKGGEGGMFEVFDIYEQRGIAIGKEQGIAIGEERGIAIGAKQKEDEDYNSLTRFFMKQDPSLTEEDAGKKAREALRF